MELQSFSPMKCDLNPRPIELSKQALHLLATLTKKCRFAPMSRFTDGMPAVVLLLFLFAAGAARAQETVSIVLSNGQTGAPASRDWSRRIAKALDDVPGLVGVIPAAPIDPKAVMLGASRAREMLDEARAANRKFDLDQALRNIQTSRDSLVRGCGGVDRAFWRTLLLLEGLVDFMAADAGAARAAFSCLAAIDPDFEPDEKALAPKIVGLYRQARQESLNRKRGSLALTGIPRGAKLRVDGREAGDLPVVIDALVAGRHCLEVTAPSYSPWITALTVPEGKSLRLRAVLFPQAARRMLEDQFQIMAVADPGELVRLFSTDWLLFGKTRPDGTNLWLVSGASGKVAGPENCKPAPPDGFAVCVRDFVRSRSKRLTGPPVNPAGGNTEPPPVPSSVAQPAGANKWYRSWWFLSIVGGVALATGVTLGLVLSSDPSQSGYRVIVTHPR